MERVEYSIQKMLEFLHSLLIVCLEATTEFTKRLRLPRISAFLSPRYRFTHPYRLGCERSSHIKQQPNILVVHISRQRDTNRFGKIKRHVEPGSPWFLRGLGTDWDFFGLSIYQ